jgi:Na+/phosphate symporter
MQKNAYRILRRLYKELTATKSRLESSKLNEFDFKRVLRCLRLSLEKKQIAKFIATRMKEITSDELKGGRRAQVWKSVDWEVLSGGCGG